MLEFLDPRTLVVATLFISLVVSVATGLYWLESDRPKGIGHAALSYASFTVALALLAGRGALPDSLSLVGANGALILSNLLMLSCLRLLADRQPLPVWVVAVGVGSTLAWFHWYSVHAPSLPMRLAYNATFSTCTSLIGAWLCLRSGPPQEVARRVVGWVLCGHAAFIATLGAAAVGYAALDDPLFSLQALVVPRTLEGMAVMVLMAALLMQLQAHRLRQRIERDAITDPLTNLLNRRGFETAAHRELQRRGETVGVLMVAAMDLDYFKRVNDRYGHLAGDHVLAGTAEVLRTALRPAEIIGRVGGEEFAMVVRLGSEADAPRLMERVRAAVEAQQVTLPSGDVLQVTLSAGFATVPVPAGQAAAVEAPEALFERLYAEADAALYRAKHAGRNRVERAAQDEAEAPTPTTADVATALPQGSD